MSLYTLNPHPSLSLLHQRQLYPYIHARSPPSTYQQAILYTVDSFQEVKRMLDWWFDVAGYQASVDEVVHLSERQKLYIFRHNSKFPPHLDSIPKADDVGKLSIFKLNRLYDTLVLIFHPYLWDINGVHEIGPAGATSLKELEDRNRSLHAAASESQWIWKKENMFTQENIGLREDWYTDTVFAQQWFTGTNPTTLALASPAWLQVFKEAAYGNQAVLDLFGAPGSNSFYVLDYSYFRSSVGLEPTDDLMSSPAGRSAKFGCASVALFYLTPTGKLHPLGIIIDWKGSAAASVTIFNQRLDPMDSTATEATDWPWRYAKTCVQVSDWTRHEVGVHLLNTHLVQEMIAVAAHRTFPSEHIVYRLLKEHWTTTLSINALARTTLVPKIVVPLSSFTEDQLFRFLNYEWENFNFTELYVPTDLQNRGFPVVELDNPKYHNYAYGRCINLMWGTLRKFVSSVLTDPAYFGGPGGDAKVAVDSSIADFCREMQSSTGAKMASFPTVTTLDGLIDMVTMCIHIAAPQHTAINYLQQYYMTFVPNKPSALFAPPPVTLNALRAFNEQDLLNALPVKETMDRDWLLMAQVPYLLSPDVEESISLTTFAWQVAEDSDKIVARAGKVLMHDLNDLVVTFNAISDEMDDQSTKYDVLIPSATAKAIVI